MNISATWIKAPGGGGGGGRLRVWAVVPGGTSDGGVRAFSTCGRFEMRWRREGKRGAGGFEAQVYSSVNRQI
jgi:hypothetical protein